MRHRLMLLFIAALAWLPLYAESRGVPTKLFEITLGETYDVGSGAKNDLGNLPVSKFTGMNTFLGHGVHYYFKPKKEYKAFPYVEKRVKPSDEYFKTSFRLYLLPVIPPTVDSIEELEKLRHKWEVATIEWSDDAKTREAAYYWARDLCKTFQIDIGSEPKVFDNFEQRLYTCSFSAGDRKFEVRSLDMSRIVQLSFKSDVFDRKDKAVESILRRLQAKSIRPY